MLSRQMHLEKRRAGFLFLFFNPSPSRPDINILSLLVLVFGPRVARVEHKRSSMLPDRRGNYAEQLCFQDPRGHEVGEGWGVKDPWLGCEPTSARVSIRRTRERRQWRRAGETKVRLILRAPPPASAPRTGSIISALIVNGFQLRPTGVNMIACCLPFLASLYGSQLRASGGGWAVDAANGPPLLPLYSHYWRIWVVKWDHKWLLCRPRLCDKTLWARTRWIVRVRAGGLSVTLTPVLSLPTFLLLLFSSRLRSRVLPCLPCLRQPSISSVLPSAASRSLGSPPSRSSSQFLSPHITFYFTPLLSASRVSPCGYQHGQAGHELSRAPLSLPDHLSQIDVPYKNPLCPL